MSSRARNPEGDALALPFGDDPDASLGVPSELTFSVGELNAVIADALNRAVPGAVWVRGEVSNFHASGNGHAYFELVEKDGRRDDVRAVMRVALFRNDRATVNRALREAGVQLGDGVEVRIRGRIDYYPPQGRLQLVMNGIDPVFTVGRMAADRAQLMRMLDEQGLLRANAARPMPTVPLRIGLVTSGGSAAYHDFVHELEVSRYAFRVAHCNARVQGAAAQRRIAYALRRLSGMDLDVVVVVRGGGSRSDLSPFDTEVVARAIAEMPFPVITGIGHEVDRTVADEVAHSFAKTPTAAAAMLVDRVAEFDGRLAQVSQRVAARARSVCRVAQHQVGQATRRVLRHGPAAVERGRQRLTARRRQVGERARVGTRDAARTLAAHERGVVSAGRRAAELAQVRLATRAVRVAPAARRGTRDLERALASVEARLRALDPQRVLERGYSITRADDGRVVRSVGDVTLDGVLVTEVADGSITSRVQSVDVEESGE